jgi:hypothetical protein
MKRYDRYGTMTWMGLAIRIRTEQLCSITEGPSNPVAVLLPTHNFEEYCFMLT